MFFPLFPAVVALAATTSTADSDALQSLVEAERGFSRMSVEQGMRDAFVANLADDGIIFQPLPVNGQQVWKPRPKSAATLIWEPAFAEISAAGDLGYTTGPWEFRPPADKPEQPVLHGHFHSVWRRAGGEPWKVAVDIGGAHEALEPGVGSGAFTAGPTSTASARGDRSPTAVKGILAAEKQFSRGAEHGGFANALAAAAAADVRWGREGQEPAVGIAAVRGALAADAAHARWTPQGSGASRSGDLGYAYGIRQRFKTAGAAPDTSVFLDVWRREGGHWRLALAVDNPVER